MSHFKSVVCDELERDEVEMVEMLDHQNEKCLEILCQERYLRHIKGIITPKHQLSSYSCLIALEEHESNVFNDNKDAVQELMDQNNFGARYNNRLRLIMRLMSSESGNFLGNVDFMREIISCIKLDAGIDTLLKFRMCCLNLAVSVNLMREAPAVKYQATEQNKKAYVNHNVMQGARITNFKDITESAFEIFCEFVSFSEMNGKVEKRCLDLDAL